MFSAVRIVGQALNPCPLRLIGGVAENYLPFGDTPF